MTKAIKIDPDFRAGSGTVCFLSWKRLETTLKATGEIRENEHISGIELDDLGIKYYIEKD